MKRTLIVLAIIALGLNAWAAKPVIKIGVAIPLSGNCAFLGENARNGLLLRLNQLPKDSRFEYKLLCEDTEFIPAKINSACRKLKDFEKVDVLVTMWGNGYDVAMPILKGSEIVHVSLDAWAKPYGYPYDFVLGAPYTAYAQKMVQAVKATGAKTAALMSEAFSAEYLYIGEVKKGLEAEGIKVLDTHSTNNTVRDFRTYILKVRELHPDIFISTVSQPMQEIMLRQMKELNFRPILAAGSANFLEITDRNLIEGAFYVLMPPPPEKWESDYRAFCNKPSGYPAPNAFDTLSLLIEACEKLPAGKKPSAAEISAMLRQTKDFPGVLGVTTFQPPNQLASPPVIYLIQKGKAEVTSLETLGGFYKK